MIQKILGEGRQELLFGAQVASQLITFVKDFRAPPLLRPFI